MKPLQAFILVLICIGIVAIIFCTRLLFSLSNEAFNNKLEGFTNQEYDTEPEISYDTHSLIPNNLPMDKPSYTKVGGYIDQGSDNLVPSEGKYQFIKPQLLYDGIWKKEINQIDQFAKNNWSIPQDGCINQQEQSVYGTNKLFDIKNESIDGMKVAVDNCSEIVSIENERKVQLPLRGRCKFYCEPDMEDILGYRIA